MRGNNPHDRMSALGQKQTSQCILVMSALPPKADIDRACWDVRFMPKATNLPYKRVVITFFAICSYPIRAGKCHESRRIGRRPDRATMVRALSVLATIALGANVALAQQDPIKDRKSLMKNNADQAKIGSAMIKGEEPFDLAKVKKIFAAFENRRRLLLCSQSIRSTSRRQTILTAPVRKSGRTWMTSKQSSPSLAMMPRRRART